MNTVVQTRIDSKSKAEAEAIFRRMGMSLSDGIRIFLCQVINDKALPFQPRTTPEFKDEVIQAMRDAQDYLNGKRQSSYKTFDTVEDAMADLMSEED